jgi:murein DD-endopeptidase MepM/ murein hydrolase activator NlpD
MVRKSFLGIGILLLTPSLLTALEKNETQSRQSAVNASAISRVDRHVRALVAEYMETKESIHVRRLMESNERARQVMAESLMYPADELYQSQWDNRYVNPFRKHPVILPASYEIDCSSFVLPVKKASISSRFGHRRRRMHNGIDLRVATGDTVRVAFDGKVRIRGFERRGYGHYVVIRHPNGLETLYAHLSQVFVNENDIVRAGAPIALGGRTGRATGSHLHFETRFMGQALNPEDLIDFENGVPHDDIYVYRNP